MCRKRTGSLLWQQRDKLRQRCAGNCSESRVFSGLRNTSSSSACKGDGDGGLKLYNSLSSSPSRGDRVAALPRAPAALGTAWYVCGPTVYDAAHLGHARTYVSLDILRRVALHAHAAAARPRPLYAMNVTDVDDKIIRRAAERGEDPLRLARRYEREFWEDMDALNVLRPDVVCRVSEHAEATIVPYIQQILDGGMAYVVPEDHMDGANGSSSDGTEDPLQPQQPQHPQQSQQLEQSQQPRQPQPQGSVYFDVRAFEAVTAGRTRYGKLAPDAAATDFFTWEEPPGEEGAPAVAASRKRDPRDWCLWKYRPRTQPDAAATDVDPVEPSSVSYASPWGPGRPGWHVECSAMIQRLAEDLKATHAFSVHAGGVDLKFPHHSNEIAQAEAYAAASGRDKSGTGGKMEEGYKLKEWIPHWIHTGHLYIQGRKMSKSLKNFVTIREMLGTAPSTDGAAPSSVFETNGSTWSSPADDFRLWVLGLSGAYRGPATYGAERMEEARTTREKWVRFLVEGHACLDRWRSAADHDNADEPLRLWGEEELRLFTAVTCGDVKCRCALMDDLDGTSFVQEFERLAEAGQVYLRKARDEEYPGRRRPVEPLHFALETCRGLLDLVGFSRRTVDAGADAESVVTVTTQLPTPLVDAAVAFRVAVRAAALSAVRGEAGGPEALKKILALCDEMRDDTFPELGVEIMDGKAKKIDGHGALCQGGWRHCVPPRKQG